MFQDAIIQETQHVFPDHDLLNIPPLQVKDAVLFVADNVPQPTKSINTLITDWHSTGIVMLIVGLKFHLKEREWYDNLHQHTGVLHPNSLLWFQITPVESNDVTFDLLPELSHNPPQPTHHQVLKHDKLHGKMHQN